MPGSSKDFLDMFIFDAPQAQLRNMADARQGSNPKMLKAGEFDRERNFRKILDETNSINQKYDDAEQERLADMRSLNGMQFNSGERSQGDQEAEQRMMQNEKTGILQKVMNFLQRPLMPDTSVEDPATGTRVNPDLLKLLEGRPDLRERFNRTGSIYSDM
tara:strand:- start:64 stop:543 length:480 start_codon:yes stop_codon:yes gene_type:complete